MGLPSWGSDCVVHFCSHPDHQHVNMSSPSRNRHARNLPPPIYFDDDDFESVNNTDVFALTGHKRRRLPSPRAHSEGSIASLPPSRVPRTLPPPAQVPEVIDLTTETKQEGPIDLDAEEELGDDEVQILYDRPRVRNPLCPPEPYRYRSRQLAQEIARKEQERLQRERRQRERRQRERRAILADLDFQFIPRHHHFPASEFFFTTTMPSSTPLNPSHQNATYRPPWSHWSRIFHGDWEEEPSYEFLSSLDRATAKKNCATKQQISALPVRLVTPADVAEDKCCAICLSDFALGEKIKTLPCKHYFHVKCIGEWLQVNKICPVDRKDIITGKSN